jgi:hypothetical protein
MSISSLRDWVLAKIIRTIYNEIFFSLFPKIPPNRRSRCATNYIFKTKSVHLKFFESNLFAMNMNQNNQSNWTKNPTKKQIIIVTIIWFVGVLLSVMSMTDFFHTSIFNKKYILIYFLILWVSYTVFKIYLNYFKNKKSSN